MGEYVFTSTVCIFIYVKYGGDVRLKYLLNATELIQRFMQMRPILSNERNINV